MLTINENIVTDKKCCTDPTVLCPRCQARSDRVNGAIADARAEINDIDTIKPATFNCAINPEQQLRLNRSSDGPGEADEFLREGVLVTDNAEHEGMVPGVIDWTAYKKKSIAHQPHKLGTKRTAHEIFAELNDPQAFAEHAPRKAKEVDEDGGMAENDEDDEEDSMAENSERIEIIHNGSVNADMIPPRTI
jgi:hypothetical protein